MRHSIFFQTPLPPVDEWIPSTLPPHFFVRTLWKKTFPTRLIFCCFLWKQIPTYQLSAEDAHPREGGGIGIKMEHDPILITV